MKNIIFFGMSFLFIFSTQAAVLDTIRIDTAIYNKLAKENKELNGKLVSFSKNAHSATESQVKYIEGLRNIPLANAFKLNSALLDSLKARLGLAKDFQSKLASHLSELQKFDDELHPKKKEKKVVAPADKAKADQEMPEFFAKNLKSKEEIVGLIEYLESRIGDVKPIVEKQKSRLAQGYE